MRSIGLLLLVSAVAFGQRTAGAGTGGGRGGGFGGGNAYAHANTYGSITRSVVQARHGLPRNRFPGSGVGGGAGKMRHRTGGSVYVPYPVGGNVVRHC